MKIRQSIRRFRVIDLPAAYTTLKSAVPRVKQDYADDDSAVVELENSSRLKLLGLAPGVQLDTTNSVQHYKK